MSTTQATGWGGASSEDGGCGSAGPSLWQLAGIFEPEPDDTDDIWPLQVWLSREETFVEDDTWHATRTWGAGSEEARGPLRSLMAAVRRVPSRSSLTNAATANR